MSQRSLADLLRTPVIVAPMGGGPSTPELVAAAAGADALGFLAAGYKTANAMRAEIEAVRAATTHPFGVNLFVAGVPAADTESVTKYVESLSADAQSLGASAGVPSWDDDGWAAKVEALLAAPPPVVSFTFGCPEPRLIAALQAAGSPVLVTVTTAKEAALAGASGADALVVQGPEAGAHRGSFSNGSQALEEGDLFDLIAKVREVTRLPLVAAGGIMDQGALGRALAAGALAAQCGTAFLRCPESGASPAHKAALADPSFEGTAVTRAFSGRPARGLVNRFMRDHGDAPAAYPEINNATRPLRAAASRRGDLERMSLWAGSGYRAASSVPAAELVRVLQGG